MPDIIGVTNTPSQQKGPNEWLDSQHPMYMQGISLWKRNEDRLRGGDDVLHELRRFDWETDESIDGAYALRQNQATYINFPDMFATMMAGHLMRVAPKPDGGLSFGSLGDVQSIGTSDSQSAASMVYYNTDGIGNDGSQWDNFWMGAMKRAMATGHRWIMCESTAEYAGTRDRQASGYRPYLVEYSPIAVTNWHYLNGRLAFAIIRLTARDPRVENGVFVANVNAQDYLLLVRKGFAALGDEYAGGGWFRFDFEKTMVDAGAWENTQGEIPLWTLFSQRDHSSATRYRMSRPATTELGQVAVSYMNLSSAADFDAWDAAKSIVWLKGVDAEGHNLAMQKLAEGSRFIPLTTNQLTEGDPSPIDSAAGAVPAEIFEKCLARKTGEAQRLAAMEATSVPDSSGLSKKAGFNELKAPRLALYASELEQAQNTAIYFLEQRFGTATNAPQGSTKWGREFDLADVISDVEDIFSLERLVGISSPTMDTTGMMLAINKKGIVNDPATLAAIEAEYIVAVNSKLAMDANTKALLDAANA